MMRWSLAAAACLLLAPAAHATDAVDPAELWQTFTDQAHALQDSGRLRGAAVAAEQSVRAAELLPPHDVRLAQSCGLLAGLRVQEDDDIAALGLYQRALQVQEDVLGPDDPALLDTLQALAGRELLLEETAVAETHLRRALALQEGAASTDAAAKTRLLLGRLYLTRGEPALAEPAMLETLRQQEAALGDHHPALADTLAWLAELYARQRDYTKASQMLERAAALLEPGRPATAGLLARALVVLANVYLLDGKTDRGLLLLQRALTLRHDSFGEAHPAIADILAMQADMFLAAGNANDAQRTAERAMQMLTKTAPANDARMAGALVVSACVYERHGQVSEAANHYRRALEIRERLLGPNHPLVADALVRLARAAAASHSKDAAALYERARSITSGASTLAPAAPVAAVPATIQATLAAPPAPADAPDVAPAAPTVKLTGETFKDVVGVAESLKNRAEVYVQLGQMNDAVALYRQVIEAYRRVLPSDHPLVSAANDRYRALRRAAQQAH